jgi:hypothetical protein
MFARQDDQDKSGSGKGCSLQLPHASSAFMPSLLVRRWSAAPAAPTPAQVLLTSYIQKQLSGVKNGWLSTLQRYPYESCSIILTLPFPRSTLSPQATSFLFVRSKQPQLAHPLGENESILGAKSGAQAPACYPTIHIKRRRLPKPTILSQYQHPTS